VCLFQSFLPYFYPVITSTACCSELSNRLIRSSFKLYLPPAGKAAVLEYDCLQSSSADIENKWSYSSNEL
jgi:hypothetical protein